jgi:hypothetical protein
LIEHDLFGKPVSTFPDHALASDVLEAAASTVNDDLPLPAVLRERVRGQPIVWRKLPLPVNGERESDGERESK